MGKISDLIAQRVLRFSPLDRWRSLPNSTPKSMHLQAIECSILFSGLCASEAFQKANKRWR